MTFVDLQADQPPSTRQGRRCLAVAAVFAVALLIGGCASLPPEASRTASTALPPAPDAALLRIAAASVPGTYSAFRLLHTGSTALDARLALIERAQHSIDAQYYQIGNDDTGRRFLRALADAADRGVRVRLLVDDLYTSGLDSLLLGLAAHGNAEVRLFNPFPAGRDSLAQRVLFSLNDFGRVNRRMHNKLFVVDSAFAISGGRNMADEFFSRNATSIFFDFDVISAGDVVAPMGAIFDRYWNSRHSWPAQAIVRSELKRSERALALRQASGGDAGLPALAPPSTDFLGAGPVRAQLDQGRLNLVPARATALADAPEKIDGQGELLGQASETDFSSLHRFVITNLALTRAHVVIVGPYNVPGPGGMERMRNAIARGVQVDMLTNSLLSTDEGLVYTAYRRYRMEMLRMGVNLYELSPTLGRHFLRDVIAGRPTLRLHTKCAVIDRQRVFIGSLNFDPRSRELNTEMGLMIESDVLAGQTLELVDRIKQQAAYRMRIDPVGDGVEWLERQDDGSEVVRVQPDLGFWRRLWLEMLAPLVPEGLL
jgi:cardiolipin synthase C